MSLKRSSSSSARSSSGAGDGAKVNRQDIFDAMKRLLAANRMFTPTDVSLAIGAGEPQVSRVLLGLAAEGCLDRVEVGKYRVAALMAEMAMPEFLKIFARASRTDSNRQKDLSEITRLKQNNDVMRNRLLQAIAERDHYLAALKSRGIDPGPAPVLPASTTAVVVSEASSAVEASSGEGSA